MRRKVIAGLVTAVLVGAAGGYALATVPFGTHVTIGCDVDHGVQTYVADTWHHLAVVQNGCTEPDIQSRIRVRVNASRGVILYQLHRNANGTGEIVDIAAVPLAVWETSG